MKDKTCFQEEFQVFQEVVRSSVKGFHISRQNVTRGGGVYGFRNSETFFSV